VERALDELPTKDWTKNGKVIRIPLEGNAVLSN